MKRLFNNIIIGITIGDTLIGFIGVALTLCYCIANYPGITLIAITLLFKSKHKQ